jgi:hypothetical protein
MATRFNRLAITMLHRATGISTRAGVLRNHCPMPMWSYPTRPRSMWPAGTATGV